MSWLMPAVTASLINSALLALVYLFLYTQYRTRYLGIWALSWGVYSLRYLFMLFILNTQAPVFWAIHLIAGLYSASLLYWGTITFVEKSPRISIQVAAILGTIWVLAVSWTNLPAFYKVLPAYSFTGLIALWLGIVLVRTRTLPLFSRQFTGYTMALWGIHLLGYPFFMNVTWFAPWAYQLSAIFALFVAIGTLLLYFQQLQEKQIQSEIRYHTLFNSAADLILIHDLDGNILEINDRCKPLLGYTREEILTMTPADITRDMDIDEVREIIANIAEAGELVFDVTLETVDHIYHHAEVHSRKIEMNGQQLILSVVRDITERKKAEDARHLSEERFSSLVNSIQEIVLTLDTELRHTGVYGKWFEHAGLTPDYFLGRTVRDLIGEQAKEHEEHYRRALNGEHVIYDWIYNDEEGSHNFQSSLSPLHDAEGNVSGLVAVGRDITDQKQIEETLRRDERRTEALLELSSMTDASESELVSFAVEKCVDFTNSDIGYVNFFTDDQVNLKTFWWSSKVRDICTMEIPDHYPIDKAGIWMDCIRQGHAVIHNDYENMTEKKGYPEGHPQIKRHMSVPIFEDDRIVLVGGVGNKIAPYDDSDVRQMSVFLNGIWEIVRRRRIEEQLKKSEARLRLLADSIVDVITLHDIDGVYMYISPSIKALTGFTPEELMGQNPLDFINADDTGLLEKYKTELNSISETDIEWRWKVKGGGYIWLETKARVITDQDGVTPRVLCVSRDITGRRRAEEALRDSEERYRRLFNQSGLVNLIFDPETGRLLDANEKACEFYGYTHEQITKMTIMDINTLSFEELKSEMQKAAKQDRNHFFFQHRLANGDIKDVEVYSTPVLIDGKKHLFSIVLDITVQKKIEAQLFQSQKMETVGRLAGGIAHDFNNLLSVIIGNAQLSLESSSCTGSLRADIHEILRAAERAATLTRQLLAFSRKQIIRPRTLDLNRTILDMDRMLRRIIGENIELVTLPAQDLWNVRMDPGQVEQVITNLVVNARDAMPEGGTLTIETGNTTFDEAFADSHIGSVPGDYVMISVTDTGIGIPERIQKYIFEPFFTTKEKDKGSGLGLSTCYGIVKQNKGNIWVDSEPDKGASFKVFLPKTETKLPAADKKIPIAMPSGTESILVAEDEQGLRLLIKRILSDCGYTVHEAAHGREAWDIFAQLGSKTFDMVISDVIMPILGGRDLVNKILEQRPDISVLFISGYTDDAIQPNQIRDNNVSFLQKPFSPAGLAIKVREILDSRQ